jgi:hypothetical protein
MLQLAQPFHGAAAMANRLASAYKGVLDSFGDYRRSVL